MTDDVMTLVRMANAVPDLAHLDADEVGDSRLAIDEALRIERTPGAAPAIVPQRQLRPLLVAAVAAAVVALIIGIPALLGRSSEEVPVVDEQAPTTLTTVAVTPTPVTTAIQPETTAVAPPLTTPPELPVVPNLAIALIDLPQSERGGVNGVTAGGPGLVAVGEAEVRPGQPAVSGAIGQGAVWASSDGLSWTAIDGSNLFWLTEEQADEGLTRRFTDITNGPAGLVAVGEDGYDGMAWTSTDGLTWSRATDDEALGGNDIQEINRVVAGGPGYVAIGRNGSTAGVWTSPDGESWTAVESESFGSYAEPAAASDVAALPSGLVVVGSGGFESDRWDLGFGDLPVVWVSPDGIAWDRLPIDVFGDPSTYFFESVEKSPDAFFLESTRGDVLLQWTSPDGRTWTRTSWPRCESEEMGAILFAEYPGAECRGIGYLEGPDGAELDVNRIDRIGPLLIITGSIGNEDEDIYEAAMWIAPLGD